MFLRIVGLNVRPWFEQYGQTLDDAPSFRIQLEHVRKDIAEGEPLIGDFEKAGFTDEAAELRSEVEAAKTLAAAIETRLTELVSRKARH